MSSQIRGLSQFIADIRTTNSSDTERARVQTELTNIRRKISNYKSHGSLTGKSKKGYEYRKVVSKLLYIYLLGYSVDLGQDEVSALIQMPEFAEKQIGYLALDLLLNLHEGLEDTIKSVVESDLRSPKEALTCLALNYACNYMSSDVSEKLSDLVFQLMISPTSSKSVTKKAALTYFNFYRHNPDRFDTETEWPLRVERIAAMLGGNDLGVVLAVCPLLFEIGTRKSNLLDANVIRIVIHKLDRVFEGIKDDGSSYRYHEIRAPWLIASLCQILRVCHFNSSKELLTEAQQISAEILKYSIHDFRPSDSDGTKSFQQQENALSLIMIDALKLCIKLNIDTWDPNLYSEVFKKVKSQLTSKNTNTRYLAIEAIQVFKVPLPLDPDEADEKNHSEVMRVILNLIKDRDISVRRQALDALYKLVDSSSVETVAAELLDLLVTSDLQIRPQMVSRLAVLIERFASSHEWYFDTCISLLIIGGTYAGEEVWQRLAQVVVNNQALHQYAVKRMYETLQEASLSPNSEPVVKLGAFILGEFSGDFCGDSMDLFLVLQDHIGSVSWQTRAVLLSSYIKFAARFPEIKSAVKDALEVYVTAPNLECQQRAAEYLSLLRPENEDLLMLLIKPMPPFDANSTSQLYQQMGNVPKVKLLHSQQQQSESNVIKVSERSQNHLSSNWELGFKRMMIHSEAVLYQDAILQIGCRYNFVQSHGKIHLYITNISSFEITSINVTLNNPMSEDLCSVKGVSTLEKSLSASQTAEMVIVCDAKQVFALSPTCRITYLAGTFGEMEFKLPLIIERFMTPSTISVDQFSQRWTQVGEEFEFSKTFQNKSMIKGTNTVDNDRNILEGMQYGVSDSGSKNHTIRSNALMGSGIIHTSASGMIGCLIILQRIKQSENYRVTVRSTRNKLTSVVLANNIVMAYQL